MIVTANARPADALRADDAPAKAPLSPGVKKVGGVAGALVVASIADRRHPGPVGQVLNIKPLPALGRISYGVYLYHWPIFLVLDEARTGLHGWVLTGVRIAVTVAVARRVAGRSPAPVHP